MVDGPRLFIGLTLEADCALVYIICPGGARAGWGGPGLATAGPGRAPPGAPSSAAGCWDLPSTPDQSESAAAVGGSRGEDTAQGFRATPVKTPRIMNVVPFMVFDPSASKPQRVAFRSRRKC